MTIKYYDATASISEKITVFPFDPTFQKENIHTLGNFGWKIIYMDKIIKHTRLELILFAIVSIRQGG